MQMGDQMHICLDGFVSIETVRDDEVVSSGNVFF